jgi:prepilin-type N-terminal cleavage/methylation domain-containing protein
MKTTKNHCNAGLTLMEIMVVVGIIGMLAGLMTLSMVRGRTTAQANGCIHNLRQIDAAANQLSEDKALMAGSPISYPSDLTPYFRQNKAPTCPAGGTYAIAGVCAIPTCSLGTNVNPPHVMQ